MLSEELHMVSEEIHTVSELTSDGTCTCTCSRGCHGDSVLQ